MPIEIVGEPNFYTLAHSKAPERETVKTNGRTLLQKNNKRKLESETSQFHKKNKVDVEAMSPVPIQPDRTRGLSLYHAIPPEERFRLIVDEQLLIFESGCEKFESREPGCLKGGASVYSYIEETLSNENCTIESFLKPEYLKKLHEKLFSRIKIPMKSGKFKKIKVCGDYRESKVYIRISSNYTEKGLLESEKRYKSIIPNGKDFFHVAKYKKASAASTKIIKQIRPKAEDLPKYLGNGAYTVDFKPIPKEKVEESVNGLLSTFREKSSDISDIDSLVKFLAEFSTALDQIHPFENGNIRVIRGVIDSILMYYGLHPLFWDDPNKIDFYDTDSLVDEFHSQIRKTKETLQRISDGEPGSNSYCANPKDKELSASAFSKSSPPTKAKSS